MGDEHTGKVFDNTLLGRIFGPMTDEVTGGWTKLHNKDVHNLYSSPNITSMMKSRMVR
jgi:hypothetical protein